MNVLYLVTGIRPPVASGSEFIQKLIFEVSKRKVNVTVISPIYIHTEKDMDTWAKEVEKKYNLRLILIDAPKFIKKNFLMHILITPFLTTIAVVKLLSKERFDIVHEFTSTPIILVRALIYRFFKAKSVFTLAVLNKTILGSFFWFKLFNFGTAYLIPSKEILSKLVKAGVDREKMFYLPPGIDTKRFRHKIDKREAIKKLGLPKDLTIVTYLGALSEEKGVLDLLRASKLIAPNIGDRIFIALFSYYLKDFKNYKKMADILSAHAPKNFQLFESRVDSAIVFAASDYVVFPQRTGHGTTIPPITVLEALASGKPIIATSILGTRELINDKCGILIPPAEPRTLSHQLEAIILREKTLKPNINTKILDLTEMVDQQIGIYYKLNDK